MFPSSMSTSMLPVLLNFPSTMTTRVLPPLERSMGLMVDMSAVVRLAGKFVGRFGRDGKWVSGGEEGQVLAAVLWGGKHV